MDNSAVGPGRPAAPAAILAQSRSRKKRFLVVSVTVLAVMGVYLGVSFLGDSGTSALNITSPASNSFVYNVASGGFGTAPSNFTAGVTTPGTNAGLRYGSTQTSGTLPAWAPAPNSAGTVTTAGDVALIDATSDTLPNGGNLLVSLYITNLNVLKAAYSSFALPIAIFRCDVTTVGCTKGSTNTYTASGSWTVSSVTPGDSGTPVGPTVFTTSNQGFISFTLPSGYYYDITLPLGGSYFALNTITSGNSVPQFYVVAQPS